MKPWLETNLGSHNCFCFNWSRYSVTSPAQENLVKKLKEWDDKIDKVISDTSWTGLQPSGIEISIADHMLIRHCFQKDDWALASTAWYSGLLPAGGLVRRQDGYTAIVYKVYPRSFIAWPAVSTDGGTTWTENLTVVSLDWQVCSNLDHWRVVETEIQCPLRQALDSRFQFCSFPTERI